MGSVSFTDRDRVMQTAKGSSKVEDKRRLRMYVPRPSISCRLSAIIVERKGGIAETERIESPSGNSSCETLANGMAGNETVSWYRSFLLREKCFIN